MSRVIDDELVEPVVRTLLGVIDVEGGATNEQLAVLRALVHGLWGRPDLDLDALEPSALVQGSGSRAPSCARAPTPQWPTTCASTKTRTRRSPSRR